MILVRLLIRVLILILVAILAFFGLYIIDEIFFEHRYVHLTVPGAFLTVLAFIPVVARLRLGKP